MLKGSKHKPEIIEKIIRGMKKGKQGYKKTTFKIGQKPFPWWKNSDHRKAAAERMYKISWKGDMVGYAGIHDWLRKKFGKPTKCENSFCKKESNKFHWAKLKNKKYERKRENFWMLCSSCHKKYDFDKNKYKRVYLKCKNCLKQFFTTPSRLKKRNVKFCSITCRRLFYVTNPPKYNSALSQ